MKKLVPLLLLISTMFVLLGCNEIFEVGEVSIVNIETQDVVEELLLSVAEKAYCEIEFEQDVKLLGVDATTSSNFISVQIKEDKITVTGLDEGAGELSVDILVDGYEKYNITIPVDVQIRTQQFTFVPEPVQIETGSPILLEDIENSLLHESTKYILAQRLARGEILTTADLIERENITQLTSEKIVVTLGNNTTFDLPTAEDTLFTMSSLDETLFTVSQTEEAYTITPKKVGSGTLRMTLERETYEDFIFDLDVYVKDNVPQVYFLEEKIELEIGETKQFDYITYPELAVVTFDYNELVTALVEESITYVTGAGIGSTNLGMKVTAENYPDVRVTHPITVTPTKTKLEFENASINAILTESTSIDITKHENAVISLEYDAQALQAEVKGDSLVITPMQEGVFEVKVLAKEEMYYDNQVTLQVTSKKGKVDLSISNSKVSANSVAATNVKVSSNTRNAEINVSATEGITATYNNGNISIIATQNGTITVEAKEPNHTTTVKNIQVTYVLPTVFMEVSKNSISLTGTANDQISISAEEGAGITITAIGGINASYDGNSKVITVAATSGGSIQVTASKNGYQSVTRTIDVAHKEKEVASVPAGDLEAQVIALVNQQRANAGLGALTHNATLTEGANIRAKEIVTLFAHTRPDGSDWSSVKPGVVYGENIAYGYTSAESVMTGWMNSQGHKENILRDYFKTIGVGVYKEGNVIYWVQLFGL